jgi:hypothetical protein
MNIHILLDAKGLGYKLAINDIPFKSVEKERKSMFEHTLDALLEVLDNNDAQNFDIYVNNIVSCNFLIGKKIPNDELLLAKLNLFKSRIEGLKYNVHIVKAADIQYIFQQKPQPTPPKSESIEWESGWLAVRHIGNDTVHTITYNRVDSLEQKQVRFKIEDYAG